MVQIQKCNMETQFVQIASQAEPVLTMSFYILGVLTAKTSRLATGIQWAETTGLLSLHLTTQHNSGAKP